MRPGCRPVHGCGGRRRPTDKINKELFASGLGKFREKTLFPRSVDRCPTFTPMPHGELAHLELLAEVDSLVDRLRQWADAAPDWQPAEKCRAPVRRLADRAASLRVRLEAPAVVATLGGTGAEKLASINAMVGANVVRTGRSRPTTTRPTLVCRPGLTPELLGIDPASVEWVPCDQPTLRDLVLIDCPDPDTSEPDEAESETDPFVGQNNPSAGPSPAENAEASPASASEAAADNLARLASHFAQMRRLARRPPRNRNIA